MDQVHIFSIEIWNHDKAMIHIKFDIKRMEIMHHLQTKSLNKDEGIHAQHIN